MFDAGKRTGADPSVRKNLHRINELCRKPQKANHFVSEHQGNCISLNFSRDAAKAVDLASFISPAISGGATMRK